MPHLKCARALALACAALATGVGQPALSQSQQDYQQLVCEGMPSDARSAPGSRVECFGSPYAIEVHFTNRWQQAIGAALEFAAETGRQPAIVLICKSGITECVRQSLRAEQTIAHWKLPIRMWLCGDRVKSLGECQVVEPAQPE